MSTGGGRVTGNRQLYFCHSCNRTVSIAPSPTSDLVCSSCGSDFIEEYEEPSYHPNPNNPNPLFPYHEDPSPFGGFSASFGTGSPLVFSSATGGGGGGGGEFPASIDLSALLGGSLQRSSPVPFGDGGEAFNPFNFLQNYIETLRNGGANIQFVIENGSGEQGIRLGLPSNFGDYFNGPGLEQLIQQLAENDPNRHGPPPAAKSAVKELPDVKIDEKMLDSDSSQCAVCKDTFELGVEAKLLPCKHIYHSECILPWLELHNSCPVCRYELPTDDPEYEQRQRNPNVASGARESSSSGFGVASQENPQPAPTVERRFRISLPWPFSGSGSAAETSNSRSGNNNSGNDGHSNPGGGGNRSGPREEDFD